MESIFLFVYGTLKRESGSEMHRFLASHSEYIDNATIKGKLYEINGYPVAVPSNNAEDIINGEVYRLKDPTAVLACLDEYEECGGDFPEPPIYIRTVTQVKLSTGKLITAWVYIANPKLDLEPTR